MPPPRALPKPVEACNRGRDPKAGEALEEFGPLFRAGQ